MSEERAIRRDERERCRDRINGLIGEMQSTAGNRRWYAARLSGLMAARSVVMRGDDDHCADVAAGGE